jgi:L-arabinokinase
MNMPLKDDKIFTGSAPGRLDVMGGIADYSGSLVLQMPITQKTYVQLRLRDDFICTLTSEVSSGEKLSAVLDYSYFLKNNKVDYQFARENFKNLQKDSWTSYIVGCALVLQKEKGIDFKGADFLIRSEVPLGKGVSSSASLEVAVMKALAKAFDIKFDGTELPILAQRVENHIVGAPCGLMDQLATYFGKPNNLLPITCQPDVLGQLIQFPENILFTGIDSGIRHSVSGASYSDVRCAAFMGFSIIALSLKTSIEVLEEAIKKNDFSKIPFGGYLANISVREFEEKFLHLLPESILGDEFLRKFKISIDPISVIDPKKKYSVKQSASHPVYENERVHDFQVHLKELNKSDVNHNTLKEMGELMYESHESYSRCGLGADRTDEIVRLAKTLEGIYGAKITGGGNGGTVCILSDKSGLQSVKKLHQQMCEKYNENLLLFI